MTSNICQKISRYGPRRSKSSSFVVAAICQLGLISYYGIWMCVSHALHELTATLLPVLFTTIK